MGEVEAVPGNLVCQQGPGFQKGWGNCPWGDLIGGRVQDRDWTGTGNHIRDRNACGSGVQVCGWGGVWEGTKNLDG